MSKVISKKNVKQARVKADAPSDARPKGPVKVAKTAVHSPSVAALEKKLTHSVTNEEKVATAAALLQARRKVRLTIPRVWRSELPRLSLFAVSLVLSVVLSKYIPSSVIFGEFIRVGNVQIMLRLPLFWLVPIGFLIEAAYQIYNVRYQIDREGIICRVGIISFRQSITKIRYEDIRSIESDQTLIERLLNVGDVEIGTAATGHIDVLLKGIGSPLKVRELIQTERERRIRGGNKQSFKTQAKESKNSVTKNAGNQ